MKTQLPPPIPTYRYITKASSTLRIYIVELLTYFPPNWIREGYLDHGATVELPCAEIFQSHIPRISVAQLRNLLPQVLDIPEDIVPTAKILLPTSRLALAYHLVTEREELIPPPAPPIPPEPIAPPPSLAPENTLPTSAPASPLEKISSSDFPSANDANGLSPKAGEESSSVPDPQIAKPSKESSTTFLKWLGKKFPSSVQKKNPDTSQKRENDFSPEENRTSAERLGEKNEEENLLDSPSQLSPKFFASLPTFIAKPLPESLPEAAVDNESPANINKPHLNTVLGKQHLITPLSQPLEPLSNEIQLQNLLCTDEQLSLYRVLDFCSQLPGLRTCMLARSWEVVAVASSQFPEGIDPLALSCQASNLLEGMRETSIKMGLGALQAVTLFSATGPVSFLQEEDLCFLILHQDQDRGFVPGVKEKLRLILKELNKSKLLLPSVASSKIEPTVEQPTLAQQETA